ncbi:HAD family hydrolase [Thioclava sp. IC9]|uniref:HAD family hydrolase n=1 Tax=Thioclava sp. IC9 TaxID=1973007 RepID=UPI000B547D4E|nr:HAD family hydrolase [Thioclava sp. IC9]OWY03181.1 phosphatase [Thioclava sp. IC9]
MAGGKIRAVLFDKDGTLFDFDATWGAWAKLQIEALAEDTSQAARLAEAIGFDLERVEFEPHSPVIAGTVREAAELLLPHLPGRTLDDLVIELERAAHDVPLVEPVPLSKLLSDLRARGLHLGICTNDAESSARAHAAQAGITDLFDLIIGCDSGHGAKPTPSPLLAFADSLGLDPAEVVMVGDSQHDLHAARAAGMIAIGVLSGPAMRDDLAPLADAVLDHIGGLPDWLAQRAG